MPSLTTAKLPMPKSWEEFEAISADIIKKIWNDELITRNGRTGQRQNGIDIYGKPQHLGGNYVGVQCKNKETDIKEIKSEIKKAENFRPPLKEMIFTIGSLSDVELQEEIRIIDLCRTKENKFSIRALFWDDICLNLAEYPTLMEKHFPQFVERKSSLKAIIGKIMDSTIKDWMFNDEEGVYTHKKDTNLTIIRDDFENNREFDEEWVKRFPDKKAFVSYHRIFYGSNLIEKVFLVAVDGYRMYIPLPTHKDLEINKFQYHVGKIINHLFGEGERLGNYDSYLDRAGINVTKEMPEFFNE